MNATADAGHNYIGRIWRVLPLHNIRPDGGCTCSKGLACKSPGKHPRLIKTGRNHLEGSTLDGAVFEGWLRKWPQMNLGIVTGFEASRLAVVDVDGAAGRATLERMEAQLGPLPPTAAVVSGRVGGGIHLYFRVSCPAPENDGDGLDIRGDGGLVVAPPSRHASGSVYHWYEPKQPLLDLPDTWLDWFASRGSVREGAARERLTLGLGPRPAHLAGRAGRQLARADQRLDAVPIEDLRAVLLVIPNPDVGWKTWNSMAMRVWDACAGNEEGMAEFEVWSAKSKKHEPGASLERWRHYVVSPPTGTGFNKLLALAREAVEGFVLPSQIPPAAPLQPLQQANGNRALVPILQEAVLGDEPKPLIRLNEQYAVIGDIGGKCMVLGFVPSKVDETIRVASFQSFKSFAERYANKYVSVKNHKPSGEVVEEVKQLGPHWLKWTGRRSYEGIDLVPGAPAVLPGNYLNLWTGFGVLPALGSWERMKWHICHILAGGDPASAQYILRFAAWAVQHPGAPAEVALVFRGDKGSGKGSFANALKRVFGQHGLQIFNSKHLVGAFNGHLRNCILLFADEAFWAGDKQGESVLKGMITEPALMIEQKGVDAAPWKNRLHVIMSANAEWVVPASHDERRYAVFDVLDARVEDSDYFRALHAELASGGLPAMLHDLQRVDLGDWHPRRIVKTEALRKQKEKSMDPRWEWWESFLQMGLLPHYQTDPSLVSAQALIVSAREHNPRLRDITATALGRFLGERGCEGFHKSQGNFWRFPTLKIARIAWERHFGNWVWKTDLEDWQLRRTVNPANSSNLSAVSVLNRYSMNSMNS